MAYINSASSRLNALIAGDQQVAARTIDVHIRGLRMRLERDETHPDVLVTVHGVGYKFSNRTLAAPGTPAARRKS